MKREENNLGIKIVEKYKAPQFEIIQINVGQNILAGSAGDGYPVEPLWGG